MIAKTHFPHHGRFIPLLRCARAPTHAPILRWRSRGSTGARVYASLTLIQRIRPKQQGHWTINKLVQGVPLPSPHLPSTREYGWRTSRHEHHQTRDAHDDRGPWDGPTPRRHAPKQADRTPWHGLRRHMTEENRMLLVQWL